MYSFTSGPEGKDGERGEVVLAPELIMPHMHFSLYGLVFLFVCMIMNILIGQSLHHPLTMYKSDVQRIKFWEC